MRDLVAWKPRFRDPRVASTRIRCLNPLRELQSNGFPIELFDPKQVDRYAVVVYGKLYDDTNYREAEGLQKLGVRIVFDLCDNHFYNPNELVSLREAQDPLRRMMALADGLVASTEAMAEVMRSELSVPRHITVIGDAVETEILGKKTPIWDGGWQRYQLKKLLDQLEIERRNGCTQLVWFGIHGGPNAEYGMLDLIKIKPLVERMHRCFPLSLTVISNSRIKFNRAIKPWRIPTRYLTWHPATFLSALRAHAITLIPISDNPFTRCKSNVRLALSLQLGLAVVADSIASYQPFAEVCCLDDWERGLEGYLSHPDLRQRHVEAGQAIVAKTWTINHIANRWRDFFQTLLADGQCQGGVF